ncbi:MAG TPA: chloride channel protein, partial [Arthrobacter sp.]|nr:chloride channel protein [Arthrobacter sp.]
GAAAGLVLPSVIPGFWALLGLTAVVGGVMRSPLTGVIFTLELTHAWAVALPLLIASVVAYGASVLFLRRSVLTEKIARRGLHLTRDYTTDPLETFFCEDIMRAPASALPNDAPVLHPRETARHAAYVLALSGAAEAAVVDDDGTCLGLIGPPELLAARLHDLSEATDRDRSLRYLTRVGAQGAE